MYLSCEIFTPGPRKNYVYPFSKGHNTNQTQHNSLVECERLALLHLDSLLVQTLKQENNLILNKYKHVILD